MGLYTSNSSDIIEYANHAFANILGEPREQIIGKNLSEYLSPNSSIPPKNSLWEGKLYFKNKDNDFSECFVAQESFRDNKEIKTRSAVFGSPSKR